MNRFLYHPLLLLGLVNAALWSSPVVLNRVQRLSFSGHVQPVVDSGHRVEEQLFASKLSDALHQPSRRQELSQELSLDVLSSISPAPMEKTPPNPVSPSSFEEDKPQPEPLASREDVNLIQHLEMAEGLGGELTLSSLQEPLEPVAVRAERLIQRRSGDPMAALPRHWRDTMEREVGSAQVSEVTMIRLPAPGLSARQEVPVVVDDQGHVSALVAPDSDDVKDVVDRWASHQSPASPGTLKVAVVAAEPLRSSAVMTDQDSLPSP